MSETTTTHPPMDHDNPDLRAQVRQHLLYPARPGLTDQQRARVQELAGRGYSVATLMVLFKASANEIWRVLGEDD